MPKEAKGLSLDGQGLPLWLSLELTYRCPLKCSWCNNPLDFDSYANRELSTAEWKEVLADARELGALQLGFTGGEPLLRDDLEELVAYADGIGFYTNLITSGIGLDDARMAALKRAGLKQVQLSLQSTRPALTDALVGARAHAHKLEAGRIIKAHGLPILAWFCDGEAAAVDFVQGAEGLLMAPVYAVPRLLARHGLRLQDFDFYEIHEAFAAQVLCTLKAWEDAEYCRTRLGLDAPRTLLAPLASRVYQHPDRQLLMIGVTGTNGKSTTVNLIAALLDEAGCPSACLGTLGYRFRDLDFGGVVRLNGSTASSTAWLACGSDTVTLPSSFLICSAPRGTPTPEASPAAETPSGGARTLRLPGSRSTGS